MNEATEAEDAGGAEARKISPELREAVMSGRFVGDSRFRDLAQIAGLTENMLQAGVANFRHQDQFEPEEWALARAFIAMSILASNPNRDLINASDELLRLSEPPK